MFRKVLVQTEDFDVGAEIADASSIGSDVGAIASFVGLCRGEGGTLNGVDLEAYPEMARRELDTIVSAASSRWALEGVTVIHRYGHILTGERIVLVAVAARHRRDAFAAAEFMMDFLKQSAPFWKRELCVAEHSNASRWVEAKSADAVAASRWGAVEGRPEKGISE